MTNSNDDKLQQLSARLKQARGEEESPVTPASKDQQQGIAFGLRAGLEMVVATLVGFALGYFLDGWLGTRPFLMVIFGFLGVGAGISNIYRMYQKMDDSVGYQKTPSQKTEKKQ